FADLRGEAISMIIEIAFTAPLEAFRLTLLQCSSHIRWVGTRVPKTVHVLFVFVASSGRVLADRSSSAGPLKETPRHARQKGEKNGASEVKRWIGRYMVM